MEEVSSYVRLDLPSYGKAAASDIDTAIVDGMKARDPDRPIREADMCANPVSVSSRIGRIRGAVSLRLTVADLRL